MNKLRLRLTLLYTSVVLAFLALVGVFTYGLVFYYLQSVTDLALRHKMAHQFATLGMAWPKELAEADTNWYSVRKSALPVAFITVLNRREEPKAQEGAAWYPQREIWLEELYDGELSAIFMLPLNAQGQLIQAQPYDLEAVRSVALPNPQAVAIASRNTHDLRTMTTPNGAEVRLLTYPVTPTQTTGSPVAYLQMGRVLDDQGYILGSLLTNLGIAGVVFALLGGLGSWRLAGRSMQKEQVLWQRQQTFVANASHELRTPLTLIRANAEVIQRKLPQDAETQPLLNDVLAEADYMNKLITDLLLLSRLDAQQIKLDIQKVSIPALLASVQRQLEPLFARHHLTLTTISEEGTELVWADPARLRQVLLILLDNALCYTYEGGSVGVRARLRTDALEMGEMVNIEVADTGVGIAPEHLAHVFDRFYHVNHGRRAGHGSGLGLSIARSLMEAHGGSIRISSMVGKGTSIALGLPVVTRENVQATSKPAKPKRKRFNLPNFGKLVAHFWSTKN